MEERFYSFNKYLQDRFGRKVYRLSLNAGFNCPNLDGTKSKAGCIFCDNKSFSRFVKESGVSLEEQIRRNISYVKIRYKAEKFIAYFQSFSNTYGELEFLKKQYSIIENFKDIVGIAISTRPDCINEEKLDLIESFTAKYEVYLEYGAQTVHNNTLKEIKRNHTFEDFENAVELTSRRPEIKCAAHIILGLPGEDKGAMLQTARILSKMPLWGVKFHCLHVVKGTALELLYRKKEIALLTEDEYVDILVDFLEIIPENWVILRLVSDADREMLVVPLWINNKQKVIAKIIKRFEEKNSYQGDIFKSEY